MISMLIFLLSFLIPTNTLKTPYVWIDYNYVHQNHVFYNEPAIRSQIAGKGHVQLTNDYPTTTTIANDGSEIGVFECNNNGNGAFSAALLEPLQYNSFALEAVAKISSINTAFSGYIIGIETSDNTAGDAIGFDGSDQKNKIFPKNAMQQGWEATNEFWDASEITGDIDTNTFYHMILSQDVNGLVTLYVNGERYGTSFQAPGGSKTYDLTFASIWICGIALLDSSSAIDASIATYGFYTESFDSAVDATESCLEAGLTDCEGLPLILIQIPPPLSLIDLQQGRTTGKVKPIPGVGWIGTSIKLLYGLEPWGPIIEYPYSGSKSADGNYDVPDNIIQASNINTCSYNSIGFTVDTYNEYQTKQTQKHNIKGTYKGVTASYSHNSETVKQNIYKNKRFATLIAAECVQYKLNLLVDVNLQQWFIDRVKSLPDNINDYYNRLAYFNFFDKYGTHIVTGCDVGGTLRRYSFTDSSYVKTYGKTDTTNNAKVDFAKIINTDNSLTNGDTVSSTYEQETVSLNIETIGGIWPDNNDNWNPWIQSVQKLQNIACINWSARDITDVFAWNDELIAKQSTAEAALKLYFDRDGCTIPTAVNYDPKALIDSGCQYPAIPEFRICFQEIEGSDQCQSTRSSCSAWSTTTKRGDISTYTARYSDDTDGRGGGCQFQWKLEQRDSVIQYTPTQRPVKYRVCFKEHQGSSSQCQGNKDACSNYNDIAEWSLPYIDDTDGRSGGCNYYWMIDQIEDQWTDQIDECRICFWESSGNQNGQCQGARNTCSGWSKTAPSWTAPFRDDTDDRVGGCNYQWKLECR